MAQIAIKDRFGNLAGYIVETCNGDRKATSRKGELLGYYYSKSNETKDRRGNLLARGDILTSLVIKKATEDGHYKTDITPAFKPYHGEEDSSNKRIEEDTKSNSYSKVNQESSGSSSTLPPVTLQDLTESASFIGIMILGIISAILGPFGGILRALVPDIKKWKERCQKRKMFDERQGRI